MDAVQRGAPRVQHGSVLGFIPHPKEETGKSQGERGGERERDRERETGKAGAGQG